ncbi:MAG: class II fructose-bisphosphate aldolase [Chloroflexi bacterium]|nr:class II fructose-bisphosphate aldolase [Chloroflexota bacterium]
MRRLPVILRLSPAGGLEVLDVRRFREEALGPLVWEAVLGKDSQLRQASRWLIRSAAQALGIYPASIGELYLARGRGEFSGFTVPAINARMLPYDTAWAAFAAARELGVGALVLELARSEMGYTSQSPDEYVVVVLAGAIKAGFQGPVFIQGDHFQVNRARYMDDPQGEMTALRQLMGESISAGFYNIDIDASTVVDLAQVDLHRQQGPNFRTTAELVEYIGSIQPPGIAVSVGGEIGEVGGRNSTVEDLVAFMEGYLERVGSATLRLTKLSVQTGTHHGGVVLPDGTIAPVDISFETLKELSQAARERYGLAGVVQHGASTLPEGMFHHFPDTDTAEVHLATEFQNIIYDSEEFPASLRQAMYDYLKQELGGPGKGVTEAQFYYRERKRALGPFKAQLWSLPEEVRASLRQRLQEKFRLLLQELRVVGTASLVQRHITPVLLPQPIPQAVKALLQG